MTQRQKFGNPLFLLQKQSGYGILSVYGRNVVPDIDSTPHLPSGSADFHAFSNCCVAYWGDHE
jgi:hypothetical protein